MRLKANIEETIAALDKKRHEFFKANEDTVSTQYEVAMRALEWVLDKRENPDKLEDYISQYFL